MRHTAPDTAPQLNPTDREFVNMPAIEGAITLLRQALGNLHGTRKHLKDVVDDLASCLVLLVRGYFILCDPGLTCYRIHQDHHLNP